MLFLSCRDPKYWSLSHTTLKLQHAQKGFKSHDLSWAATVYFSTSFLLMSSILWSSFYFPEDDPFWLPLYGKICCRLLTQALHESANHKQPATDYGSDMVLCDFTSMLRYFNPQCLSLMSFSRVRTLAARHVFGVLRKTSNVMTSRWPWSWGFHLQPEDARSWGHTPLDQSSLGPDGETVGVTGFQQSTGIFWNFWRPQTPVFLFHTQALDSKVDLYEPIWLRCTGVGLEVLSTRIKGDVLSAG